MKKNTYENWAVEHILDYWILQDKYHNAQSIKLYEALYNTHKKNKTLKETLKQGLELLYVERKQIKHRETYLRGQARECVLGWR